MEKQEDFIMEMSTKVFKNQAGSHQCTWSGTLIHIQVLVCAWSDWHCIRGSDPVTHLVTLSMSMYDYIPFSSRGWRTDFQRRIDSPNVTFSVDINGLRGNTGRCSDISDWMPTQSSTVVYTRSLEILPPVRPGKPDHDYTKVRHKVFSRWADLTGLWCESFTLMW